MAYTSLSGKKLQRKLGASLNESASAPTSSFAKKQLEKMGWKEGEGLGARSTGIKTHIKVHKREDEVGIGHEKLKSAEASNMWWSSSISSTLAKLSSGKKKKSKKEKKRTKYHYTDEELFEATGGARFGMRAQRRAESKWARSEKSSELIEQEGKAKEMFEWNGLGEAKCLLNEGDADKKKQEKKQEKKLKRKRKRDRQEDASEEKKCDDSSHEKDTSSIGEKKKKQEKKKKASKKKKKNRKKMMRLEDVQQHLFSYY